jgi:hypothetical protein
VYPAQSAKSWVLLSTNHVDKSVEKLRIIPLSARSVSSPNQIGEKASKIEINPFNSVSYGAICGPHRGLA